MTTKVRVGGLSDVGLVRQSNEDHFGSFEPPGSREELGRLLIVADGVGGHRGGGLASRLAVDIVAETFFLPSTVGSKERPTTIEDRLLVSFREANRRIHVRSLEDASVRGMASTCTALVLSSGCGFVAHLGDSRAYLLRSGSIRRLTHDHSVVQYRIDAGLLTPDQARTHSDRNIITRSMGFEPIVEPDILTPSLALQTADLFVLCTDGLHGLLSDEEIADVARTSDPEEACRRLVAMAKERGGADNITVQILRVEEA